LEQILIAGKSAKAFDIADTRITTLAIIGMLTEVVTWYRPDGRLKLDEVKSTLSGNGPAHGDATHRTLV
jgi:hypothetical protein